MAFFGLYLPAPPHVRHQNLTGAILIYLLKTMQTLVKRIQVLHEL